MYDKCTDCPFHKIIPDPDPTDWFNRDDEAIVCTKITRPIDKNSNYGVDRQQFKPIDVALRPYQTKNVNSPEWCPISKDKLRNDKLEKILTT